MKVLTQITTDLETGEYEIKFNNLSQKGDGIDFEKLMLILQKALEKEYEKIAESDQTYQQIH